MPEFDGSPYTQLTTPARSDVKGVVKDVSEADPALQTKYVTMEDDHQFGSWASKVRVVTASGSVTLLDTDPMFIEIDPNGSNRDVNFPAKSDDNHGYVILHSGSANILTLKRSGGSTITTLEVGEAKYIMPSTIEDFNALGGGSSGSSSTGWEAVAQTWTYASADDPVYQIYVSGNVTADANYKLGNKVKMTNNSTTFYGFIVKVGSYDGGNNRTPVDIYGGTDYDLANSAITSPYISKIKSPDGFTLDPNKWTVSLSDTTLRTQSSPTASIWYNLGSLSLAIPIGIWNVEYKVNVLGARPTSTNLSVFATLSTANNSESDADLTAYGYAQGASATIGVSAPLWIRKTLVLTSKTTYYMNSKTESAGSTSINFDNAFSKLIVRAVCAYL